MIRPSALRRLQRLVLISGLAISAAVADAQFLSGFDAFRAGEYCKARDRWLKSERDGDSSSAFGLAELYARGFCVKQNDRLATRWYLTAALRGNSRARAEVGVRYAYGKGVKPDAFKAYVWISAGKLSAAGWDTTFVETADANLRMLRESLTAAERQRADKILAVFVRKWALPREFNSLD
jgi:hypothetical protein